MRLLLCNDSIFNVDIALILLGIIHWRELLPRHKFSRYDNHMIDVVILLRRLLPVVTILHEASSLTVLDRLTFVTCQPCTTTQNQVSTSGDIFQLALLVQLVQLVAVYRSISASHSDSVTVSPSSRQIGYILPLATPVCINVSLGIFRLLTVLSLTTNLLVNII